MSPDHDDSEHEGLEEETPPSLFSRTWVRVALVALGLAVVGAIALPKLIDTVTPPPPTQPLVATTPPPVVPLDAPSAISSSPAPGASLQQSATTPLAPAQKSGARASGLAAKAETRPRNDGASKATARKSESARSEAKVAAPQSAAPDPAEGRPPKPAAVGTASAASAGTPVAEATPKGGENGEYWVQVGAFRSPETARQLAVKLRGMNFRVDDGDTTRGGIVAAAPAAGAGPPSPGGSHVYDIFVTGLAPSELGKKLAPKGLSAETGVDTLVVRPSLPLRDAVALSKELAADGLKVQVKRARSPGETRVPAPRPAVAGNETLHRVRVGAFSERASAVAAQRELEEQGYKGFIARGSPARGSPGGGESSP